MQACTEGLERDAAFHSTGIFRIFDHGEHEIDIEAAERQRLLESSDRVEAAKGPGPS